VASGAADLALLPIENTTAGSINETYDLLAPGALHITGEVVSAIEHCLLALPGVTLDELRTVISHPQALAQCHDLVRAPCPAGAARRPRHRGRGAPGRRVQRSHAGGDRERRAARRYGLAVLERGIQSAAGNATRFVEIATAAGAGARGRPDQDVR